MTTRLARHRFGSDEKSMQISLLRLAVTGLLGVVIGLPAVAQIDNGLPGPQPLDAGALILSDNMLRLNLSRIGSKERGSKTSIPRGRRQIEKNTRATVSARTSDTTYRASPSITRKVRSQYLGWVRQRNPQEARALQRIFDQHDPIKVWQGLVASYGLKTGNSADALSAYWILNHLLANQSQPPTRSQALAVRAQIRSALASNPAFRRLSSTQRQEASEVWMLNFVVQQGAYRTAIQRGDKVFLAKLASAAKARFQNEMRVDLTQFVLTARGFQPRT
jgi:hypothetical protein